MIPCPNCGEPVNPWEGFPVCVHCRVKARATRDGSNPLGMSLWSDHIWHQETAYISAVIGARRIRSKAYNRSDLDVLPFNIYLPGVVHYGRHIADDVTLDGPFGSVTNPTRTLTGRWG